nr:FAD-dependent oxidoreductase [Demequina litorisediminis]
MTDALAADAVSRGAHILTSTVVTSLREDRGRWQVRTADGTLVADEVVVASSRPAAAALVPQVRRAPDRQVALVTLSLDAPELDSHPRGSGVLAIDGVTRAKALTHATAKWEWVAKAAPDRHIVRLSYALDTAEDLAPHALADASRLLGVPLRDAQVRDLVQVVWHDASPTKPGHREPAPGLHLVGAAAGFSGLAAIVDDDQRSTLGA